MADSQPDNWITRALQRAAEPPPDNWWPDEAMRRAVARFYYEPMTERGLMRHARAWRIAMADLFGTHTRQPEEFGLAAEYDAEVGRLFHHDG